MIVMPKTNDARMLEEDSQQSCWGVAAKALFGAGFLVAIVWLVMGA